MTTQFSVVQRNPGHWDINGPSGRLFRIRGTPGAFVAMDECAHYTTTFQTFSSCVLFVMESLMEEPLVPDQMSPGNNLPMSV